MNTHNRNRVCFLLLLILILLCPVKAQDNNGGQSFHDVKKSIRLKTRAINSHHKSINNTLKKHRNRHDSSHVVQLLSDYIAINTLAPANTVANPSESYFLTQNVDLSRRQLKTIERMEHQLTRAKDEWHNYARNGNEFKSYFEEVASDSLYEGELKKQLYNLLSNQIEKGGLSEKLFTENLYSHYMRDIQALIDPLAGYEMLISNAFNYSEKDFERLANGTLPIPFQDFNASLREGHQKLLEVKEKYGSFDIDSKTGISKNSLHKQNFRQRLNLGGTFHFSPVKKGLKLDLQPLISFSLNRNWTSGLSGNFRLNFGENNLSDLPTGANGFRVYLERNAFKDFLLHTEWEYISAYKRQTEISPPQRQNSNSLLVGAGKKTRISARLNLLTYWLYHLGNNKGAVYNSPWVFRFGFNIENK